MCSEYEERKRQLDGEINSMDIASAGSNNSNYYYPSKKTLRR